MKAFSAILAILILFLTMQPMLISANYMANNKTVDKCCLDKENASKKKDKESNKNCCNDGHCDNPFLSCANCFFLNIDNSFSVVKVNTFIKKVRLTNDKVSSSYIQDFWHPPQIDSISV